jgi:hypothetical protein
VQYHVGSDGYDTVYGNQRASFYGVSGIPDTWFDGDTEVLGGAAYTTFLNAYNNVADEPSYVTVELGGEQLSGQTYRITCRVSVDPDSPNNRNPRVHLVQVLDYWPAYPTYHRNGFKQAMMTPVEISLMPGESYTFTHDFTFDSTSWSNQEDIKIVAWAQKPLASKPAQVFNSATMTWPFEPLVTNDPGDMNCDGELNTLDIEPFVMALTNPTAYQFYYPDCDVNLADINDDGAVNTLDIEAFVDLLTGP